MKNSIKLGIWNTLGFCAIPFVLLFPYINELIYYSYPFFSREALILFLYILAFSFLLALVSRRLKKYFLINSILLGFFVTFSLTLQSDLSMVGACSVLLASILVFYFLKNNATNLVGIFFLTMIIVSLLKGNDFTQLYAGKLNKNLPPVIHIILDEHVGISGIPKDIQGGKSLALFLRAFYKKYHFKLYENVYSHSHGTYATVNMQFNFSSDALPDSLRDNLFYFHVGLTRKRHALPAFRYIKLLEGLGYHFIVFQPGYMEYCGSIKKKLYCRTYPDVNLKLIYKSNFPIYMKTKYLFAALLFQSKVITKAFQYYLNFHKTFFFKNIVFPTTNTEILDELRYAISKDSYGKIYFAHVLAPHLPYFYNQHCQIVEQNSTLYHPYYGQINASKFRKIRYQLYFNQIRCVYKKLVKIIQKMKRLGIFDKSLVLLQGDHGSRITINKPTDLNFITHQLTAQDILDNFSTLYAVKFPGKKFKRIKKVLPLEVIFADTLNQFFDFGIQVKTDSPFIYLERGRELDFKIYLPKSIFTDKFNANLPGASD